MITNFNPSSAYYSFIECVQKIDPRPMHRLSMERVQQALNKDKVSRSANFRAVITCTASFATQFFILILKNTMVGCAKGLLNVALLKAGSPNWRAWKGSAEKTRVYAIGTLLSITAFQFPKTFSTVNAGFQYRNEIFNDRVIAEVWRTFLTKIADLRQELGAANVAARTQESLQTHADVTRETQGEFTKDAAQYLSNTQPSLNTTFESKVNDFIELCKKYKSYLPSEIDSVKKTFSRFANEDSKIKWLKDLTADLQRLYPQHF